MALTSKRPSTREQIKAKLIDEVTDVSDKKCRLNTQIEESLYRQIKIRAAQDGRSISEITRELWLEYLSA